MASSMTRWSYPSAPLTHSLCRASWSGPPEGLAQTCRAIVHCRTGHRGSKSMTEELRGSELPRGWECLTGPSSPATFVWLQWSSCKACFPCPSGTSARPPLQCNPFNDSPVVHRGEMVLGWSILFSSVLLFSGWLVLCVSWFLVCCWRRIVCLRRWGGFCSNGLAAWYVGVGLRVRCGSSVDCVVDVAASWCVDDHPRHPSLCDVG